MQYCSPKPISSHLINEMKKKRIWSIDCPIHHDRLQIIQVPYIDFNGIAQHKGQIIVLDIIAEHVSRIFQELYHLQFPIAKICLINEYDGDDIKSMNDNNSHGFNHRKIAGSNKISLHSYGVAIDINPVMNPYLTLNSPGLIEVQPNIGTKYLNRSNLRQGMVEPIVKIFKRYGFVWGGEWDNPIDWHHFQLSRELTEHLISMPKNQAIQFFKQQYPI